jgi:hypothetical protein
MEDLERRRYFLGLVRDADETRRAHGLAGLGDLAIDQGKPWDAVRHLRQALRLGGGVDCSAAVAATVAPYQDISPGRSCGLQTSFLVPTPDVIGIGPSVQYGIIATTDKEGRTQYRTSNPKFGEVGVAAGLPYGPAVAATCINVYSPPILSW